MRRVITGHSSDGKSVVASDTEVDAVALGTWVFFTLWGADKAPVLPDDGSLHPFSTFVPPAGGFRFFAFTVPVQPHVQPGDRDRQAVLAEMEKKLPGLAQHYRDDNKPGMHAVDTIDCIYIISGQVWLELDDGQEVFLRAGDTVVQNGTSHSWRNDDVEPCGMVCCSIGVGRRAQERSTDRT